MRWTYLVGVVLLVQASACACSLKVQKRFCKMEVPPDRVPATSKQIRSGMSRADVEEILGKSNYSPMQGQHYYSTGGVCEVAPGRSVPCGYVLEYEGDDLDARLDSCWWGGVAE